MRVALAALSWRYRVVGLGSEGWRGSGHRQTSSLMRNSISRRAS